jgi:predicted thioesterase
MNLIDSKQVMAMAEYASDRAKQKLDDAIDAEETREELIAARTQELIVKRMAEMAPIDVVAGMQSVMEDGAARQIAKRLLQNDMAAVGLYVQVLIREYIAADSEVMAQDWLDRVEREAAMWEKH